MTAPLEKPDEELGRLFRDERAHEEVSLAQIERFAARLASTLALAAVPPAPTLPTAATPTAATSTAATSTAANAPSMLLGRAISLAVLCALGGTAVGFALGRWTAPAVLVPASPEPATDDASVEPDAGLEATPPTLEAAAPVEPFEEPEAPPPTEPVTPRSDPPPRRHDPPPTAATELATERGDPAAAPLRMEEEQRLLDASRAALSRGRPTDALGPLAEHARRFPEGTMAEEREFLWITVLAAANRPEEARARGEHFLAERPRSLYARRVTQTLAQLPSP